MLVVQIDQDFERRLLGGQPADVQVIADGRNSNTAATAMGYVNSIVEAFNADWRASHGQPKPPIQITRAGLVQPEPRNPLEHDPSLIGTLTMLQTLLLTAMSVAREREQGTFDQLLVTPFRPTEIMAGKALPSMLIGATQATTILLVAQLWFRIPFAGSFVDALRRARAVPAGGGRHRAVGLVARGDDAAGDAVLVHDDDAVLAALGPDHADQQHARGAAILHADQPAAVRDRHRPAGLSGRSQARPPYPRSLAAGDHRRRHALRRLVDVSASVDVITQLSRIVAVQ